MAVLTAEASPCVVGLSLSGSSSRTRAHSSRIDPCCCVAPVHSAGVGARVIAPEAPPSRSHASWVRARTWPGRTWPAMTGEWFGNGNSPVLRQRDRSEMSIAHPSVQFNDASRVDPAALWHHHAQ